MTARQEFHVQVPYRLIQGIRLVHALMETDYHVHVPVEHVDKFSQLRDAFGVDFAIGIENVPELPAVSVSHSAPSTAVGSVRRPLIFPHAIVRRCRDLWPDERPVRFSFAGLVTDKRREALNTWARQALPAVRGGLPGTTVFDRLASRVRRVFSGRYDAVPDGPRDLVIWPSDRGRRFPGKTWDEDYQSLLAHSQFVLCPNGDHVWSYRFFEAALCGAIPVIEEASPVYEGFRYRTMDDPLENGRWDREEAEHNFGLCEKRLAVPLEELNAEIASLLTMARTA